ncbi:MAG: efflux RND transporter periplasmic adaptor subunit [Desulfovibrio sp.]|jgi:membrane fusion protein (multidrug efflux system)|nr:efflux RND transporter periplasmic adaptor subunit [Desulfovibrio sp.]
MFYFSRRIRRAGVLSTLAMAAALFSTACDKTTKTEQAPPEVSYIVAGVKDITLTTELSGRTSAFMVAEVRPQVSGIIMQRLFVEGSDVKQGDVLYQIDPALYQAAHDNAKATLEKARANQAAADLLAQRYSEVVKVNAVSKQDYDNALAAQGQAKAEVLAAQAALDTASINLQYTRVTAPISGRIGRSSVTPGALVTQNQPSALSTIQQLDPMYVDVTQSSTEILRLKKDYESGSLKSSGEGGMHVSLLLEDGSLYQRNPEKNGAGTAQKNAAPQENAKAEEQKGDASARQTETPLYGILKFSEVNVEQSTGAVTIRAVFPNPDGMLLPGMYVRAVFEEGVKEKAILLPQKTIIRNNRGLPTIRLLTKNATLEKAPDIYNVSTVILNTSRVIDGQWLISNGVKEGDLVLFEGIQKVQAGKPVKGVPNVSGTGNSPEKSR